jgi:hypothetical protein
MRVVERGLMNIGKNTLHAMHAALRPNHAPMVSGPMSACVRRQASSTALYAHVLLTTWQMGTNLAPQILTIPKPPRRLMGHVAKKP